MEELDVLYTTDKNYVDMMLGSIYSLLINGNIGLVRLHIITSGFSLEDYTKVENALKNFGNVDLHFYSLESFDINSFNIPDWHGVQIANARLFFQEYLASNLSNIDNLLYLDSDTIVVSDINGLSSYREDLVCASKDEVYPSYLQKMGELSKYFNSGVILFNSRDWTNNNAQDSIIHFLETNKLPLTFPDQDVLNCALNGNITELPLNYNLGSNAYLFSPSLQRYYFDKKSQISNREVEEAKKRPVILHSTGFLGLKPWLNNNINPYNEEFMRYILMANPEFQKRELSKLKQCLTISSNLYKLLFLLKMNMPDMAKDIARKLVK